LGRDFGLPSVAATIRKGKWIYVPPPSLKSAHAGSEPERLERLAAIDKPKDKIYIVNN